MNLIPEHPKAPERKLPFMNGRRPIVQNQLPEEGQNADSQSQADKRESQADEFHLSQISRDFLRSLKRGPYRMMYAGFIMPSCKFEHVTMTPIRIQ